MAQHKGDCSTCGRRDVTVFDDVGGDRHCRQCLTSILPDVDAREVAKVRREYREGAGE